MARTKTYQPGQALDQAMLLFWRKGYGATSIEDLAEETGLSRSSLYTEFGSKRELFSLAIGRYLDLFAERLAPLSHGGLESISAFFEGIPNTPVEGCLMVNGITELGVSDPDFERDATRYRTRIVSAFTNALERAEATGQINPGKAAGRAELLTVDLLGIFVEARISDPRPQIEAVTAEVQSWRRLSFRTRRSETSTT